ncbi:sigma-70 family RNA polymerase sigma factor [Listeria monocytogenes]|uniref:Sigma-70 family RNA polymerase sigma factor n=1 Tax=Listeria monocytogenes TaxID=1639 RepID=A0A9P3QU58_LISMN|nr:sigma-70 family RNA polymerase sigma factor [Listeria monocytogenes]EAD5036175.1 sigma-70 family RNA polymerase sigma factor [Listeria monocytogenes serotype 1/2a]EAA0253316.1 sigma-70 family RNA polymerase sigma factor [Listeria monocytogenes]EAC2419056.1 sigma-70 family RNA polymerase sigma factor [Listeria monocytogenes]EAC2697508.1 sigma-70 family RNA polymerase sigma factor [Listeria monocytogenes]EAC3244950.1 sigma-70 family RNA polymerase sigma factor [Listeria monocytogenes]
MENTPSDNKIKKYLRIGIHYHANNYYRKKKNYTTRSVLTDFQELDPNSFSTDTCPDSSTLQTIESKDFEDYFDNDLLIKAIKGLSTKEKKFLFEKFILRKSDTELAKERNLTQQAISVYKKRLLKKVKVLMKS